MTFHFAYTYTNFRQIESIFDGRDLAHLYSHLYENLFSEQSCEGA